MRNWLDVSCKLLVLAKAIDALPSDIPGVRELRIQNAKLLRMLFAPPWKVKAFTNTSSVKKYRKKEGKYAAKVGKQEQKVREMSDKAFKHFIRRTMPMTNAEYREWRNKLESSIAESAGKMGKQVTDGVAKMLPARKPFSRTGRRS